ncbi:uncharacterized protein STEHIDRAFT_37338, partial [Stereum hirsutum FP-91666 SS1]
KQVYMLEEETVHYDLGVQMGRPEWDLTSLPGGGIIRLGKLSRPFSLSMEHELHCINTIAAEIAKAHKSRWEHVQHCLNYIRQVALCRLDLTLEPGDFSQRNFTTERTGVEHTCTDWITLYDMLADDEGRWEEYQASH